MPAAGRLAWAVATAGGLGDRLPAPGTLAGSLPAALLWWLWWLWWLVTGAALGLTAQTICLALAVVLATSAGIWAAGVESARRGVSDPGPIVIDEVAGQWLTYLVALPWAPPATATDSAVMAGLGLALFRVFDVLKPWPIRRFERLPGGTGVLADDLAAGIAAGACLLGLRLWLG